MTKKALIFGITGQDGSYLSRLLLKKNYEVHGVKRRSSSFNTSRIDNIYQDPFVKKKKLILHYGDITDSNSVFSIIKKVNPNEIYNLAAQSHVAVSFENPEYTTNTDALGTLRILDSILRINKKIKFYQAGSSEMFGKVMEVPQTENTPFYPRSPYGVAKVYSHWITKNYRESYKIFASNGILFNHESPIRGETFVTRKITRAVARISLGQQKKIFIGNLDAKRDWGHAKDYVKGMWLMLQQENAEDFVLATGKTNTVRHFCELAFLEVGIKIEWKGEGDSEKGLNAKDGSVLIEVDKNYYRPTEVDLLIGDPTRANKQLGWKHTYSLKSMIAEMVQSDVEIFRKEQILKEQGFEIKDYFE